MTVAEKAAGYGLDAALVVRAYQHLTLTDSGVSYPSVTPLDDKRATKLQFGWAEQRADGLPGRCCTVTVKLGGAGNEVYLGNCDVNYSSKERGHGRQTRDFSLVFGSGLNAPTHVCAQDDGAGAWLALEGQPDDDDHDALVRKMRHRRFGQEVMNHVLGRDFVGLRRRSRVDFNTVVDLLRPWNGGWTVQQAHTLIGTNEGPR